MKTKVTLLKAATKIFAKSGFDQTSIDDIVQCAGVAKGTFYYHYKSKDEVFLDIIAGGIDDLTAKMAESAAMIDDPQEKFEAIINSQFDFFITNKDFCKLFISDIWRLESKWKQKYVTRRDQYVKSLIETIELGQKANIFKSDLNPSICAVGIFGYIATSSLDMNIDRRKDAFKVRSQAISLLTSSILLYKPY